MAAKGAARLLLLLVAHADPAWAEPDCGAAGPRFVTLALAEADRDSEASQDLLAAVSDLLQAQLAQRRLRVCPAEQAGGAPLARVVLSFERTSSLHVVSAQIEIDDSLTGKQVSRHVELLRSTADSVPLALAVSVDELLRASWAAPPPPQAPRMPAVSATEEVRSEPTGTRTLGLSVHAAALAETDASSRVRFGVGGGLQLEPARGAFIGLRGAYLHALAQSAPHGRLVDRTAVGLLNVGVALTSQMAPAGVELAGWLSLGRTSVEGIPTGEATGATRAFVWWGVGGEVLGWVGLGSRLQLISAVSAGLPLRAADALDGEQRLPLLRGPLMLGQLGLRWKLR